VFLGQNPLLFLDKICSFRGEIRCIDRFSKKKNKFLISQQKNRAFSVKLVVYHNLHVLLIMDTARRKTQSGRVG
jgi:hypothetical protein